MVCLYSNRYSQIITSFSLRKYKSPSILASTWKMKLRVHDLGNYSCLKVDLIFTRDRAFYFTTVFIPGIILVTSSFITFWLEWNAVPARVMIGKFVQQIYTVSYLKNWQIYSGPMLLNHSRWVDRNDWPRILCTQRRGKNSLLHVSKYITLVRRINRK